MVEARLLKTRWWKDPITGLLLKNGEWKIVNRVQIKSAYLKKEVNRGKIELRGQGIAPTPKTQPEKAVLTGKLPDTEPKPMKVEVKATKQTFTKGLNKTKKSKKGKK